MYKQIKRHLKRTQRREPLPHAARLGHQGERGGAHSQQCQSAFSTPVTLPDGSSVTIRSLHLEDRPAIRALFERLSPETLAQRFHAIGFRITDTVLDQATAGHALVGELEGAIVALASYYPQPDDRQAEVAIVVDDAHQGRGIGLALGACLSRQARRAGIQHLRAEVQGSNRRMFKLLHKLDLPMTTTWAQGAVRVEITLRPDAAQIPHHERTTTCYRSMHRPL